MKWSHNVIQGTLSTKNTTLDVQEEGGHIRQIQQGVL